jgi:hypothetical protein
VSWPVSRWLPFLPDAVQGRREWPGFIVLRLGSQARKHVMSVLRRLAPSLATQTMDGRLWVVTETEIRIRGGEEDGR